MVTLLGRTIARDAGEEAVSYFVVPEEEVIVAGDCRIIFGKDDSCGRLD